MSQILSKVTARIAVLQRELDELRTTERVLRRLENGQDSQGKSSTAQGEDAQDILEALTPRNKGIDLKGKTVLDAAKTVMGEDPEPLHFKEIYNRAALRGYRGRKSGGNPQTFWAMLSRNKKIFEAKGEGKYVLRKTE